ncbi:ClpP family protease [Anaerosporobacter sp.]
MQTKNLCDIDVVYSTENSNAVNKSKNSNDSYQGKSIVDEKVAKEKEKLENEKLQEFGQVTLDKNRRDHKLHLLTIIGEIEGHECLPQQTKTTKYEHILPQLAVLEDSEDIEGVLILVNTIGGAVESGLAIAEMIASLSKPTVSLILGDSHSIGVPLAVATDYSFIVPTGTVIIHPVRMSGTVIGSRQTYDYFKIMQDRIVGFIADHSNAKKERLEMLMFNTTMLSKDLGTILVGGQAVEEGIVDAIGGIHDAIEKLYDMIEEKQGSKA